MDDKYFIKIYSFCLYYKNIYNFMVFYYSVYIYLLLYELYCIGIFNNMNEIIF